MRKPNSTPSLTRSAIVDALMELLKEMPYGKISISAISERAHVNRSTFYRTFGTKEDVVRAWYRRMFEGFMRSIPNSQAISIGSYYTRQFMYYQQYKRDLTLLERAGLSHLMLDALEEMFSERNDTFGRDATSRDDVVALAYHTGGIFNTLRRWIADGMSASPNDMALATVRTMKTDFTASYLRTR